MAHIMKNSKFDRWGLKDPYTFKHVWRGLCPAHKFQAELENHQTYSSNMFEEKAPHYTIKSVCQTNISNKLEEAYKFNFELTNFHTDSSNLETYSLNMFEGEITHYIIKSVRQTQISNMMERLWASLYYQRGLIIGQLTPKKFV